ncbi:MAG: acyl-CoA synthetase (AMP-forming)/AMP-acid ligase [Prolixibacteraceae bacterium]|nr:MAG: acyl-CoA synthetase (AMP-forming)/AMP-acid ligase [Prolixibacteraceae bacterium]
MNVVQYLFENSFNLAKDFVLGNKETISYTNLYDKASQMASYLSSSLGSNRNIILVSNNNNFFLIGYLGVMMSGNVCVPIDPSIEQKNFDYILQECDAPLVLIERRLLDRINTGSLKTISDGNYTHLIKNQPHFNQNDSFNSELPAQIIFTSGSTGVPKGVVLSHRNIIANTSSILQYLHLSENDIMEVVLPFYYCYGLSLLHTHLRAGGSLVLNNNFIFISSVFNDINKYKCTGFAGVPSHFQILLRKSEGFKNTHFPSLRYVTQAGGKLHNSFIEEFINTFPEISFYVMYGQTEATARLSYLEPNLLRSKLGSIGKGIPNVELKVVNQLNENVLAGETGEIIARGENIMLRYYKNGDETNKTIKNGWLYTGDMGTVDNDGYIYLTARNKEFIKIAGKRVSPKEIEEVIVSYPGIVDCTIETVDDEITGEAVKAVVVLAEGFEKSITEDVLKAWCAGKLAIHKLPKCIEFADSLRIGNTGKKVKRI